MYVNKQMSLGQVHTAFCNIDILANWSKKCASDYRL